jgi:beta-xylosidase
MYFGGLWGGQLAQWQTGEFLANVDEKDGPAADAPAMGPRIVELSDDMLSFKGEVKEISIVDENGKPIVAGDEDRRYFEGPWMHKYNGYYYLSYSTGSTHKLVYAMSKNPEGPFEYKGTILTPVLGWTTHHSIIQYQDKWYLFYHDCSLSGGTDHLRSVKFTEIQYNEDGTIQMLDYNNLK